MGVGCRFLAKSENNIAKNGILVDRENALNPGKCSDNFAFKVISLVLGGIIIFGSGFCAAVPEFPFYARLSEFMPVAKFSEATRYQCEAGGAYAAASFFSPIILIATIVFSLKARFESSVKPHYIVFMWLFLGLSTLFLMTGPSGDSNGKLSGLYQNSYIGAHVLIFCAWSAFYISAFYSLKGLKHLLSTRGI